MAKSDDVIEVGGRWYVGYWDPHRNQYVGPLIGGPGRCDQWFAYSVRMIPGVADRSYAHRRSAVRAATRVYGGA